MYLYFGELYHNQNSHPIIDLLCFQISGWGEHEGGTALILSKIILTEDLPKAFEANADYSQFVLLSIWNRHLQIDDQFAEGK